MSATTALAVAEREQHHEITEFRRPSEIKARVQAIQGLMKDVLQEGTDYGVIPGMPKDSKPSLFKPGSEQILAMFQIAVDPIVEDLSTDDCFRYRVTCRLTNANTKQFLGSGIGECSSNETKYKWRRTYVQAEYEATPEDRRRIKYGRFKNNQGKWTDFQEMQVRQEPADVANTVLKIAKKRGQIDGCLTVTGASSMFSQDLEDMSEEARAAETGGTFADGSPIDEPVKTTTKKETKAETKPAAAQPAEVLPPEKAKPAAAQPQAEQATTSNGDIPYITDPQRRRLFAIMGSAGKKETDFKAYAGAKHGVHSTKAIPASKPFTYGVYEALCDWADPKFEFHQDEFVGHEIGVSMHKSKAPAAAEDPDW